jgi:hypothetical protein
MLKESGLIHTNQPAFFYTYYTYTISVLNSLLK